MLTSKEIIERTGISRATLNNYIGSGLVPRPQVLPPGPEHGAAPRIGYFPDDTIERIEAIQRMKREGWSITRIAEHFGLHGSAGMAAEAMRPGTVGEFEQALLPTAPPARPETPDRAVALDAPGPSAQPPAAAATPGVLPAGVRLTPARADHPAWLVNDAFRLVWINEPARHSPLSPWSLPPAGAQGAGTGSVFHHLFEVDHARGRDPLLRFHLQAARGRGAHAGELFAGLAPAEAARLEAIYRDLPPPSGQALVAHAELPADAQPPRTVHAVHFQEGVLFAVAPQAQDDGAAQPGLPAAPELTPVAVWIGLLQDAAGLWVRLSAEEYFELLNEIGAELDAILRQHHGRARGAWGETLACYFLPRHDGHYLWDALAAAQQAREAMRQISQRWRARKGWDMELCLNIGIDAGRDWLGALGIGGQADLRVLGDASDRAGQLARCSRMGSILLTRNLVGSLSREERQRLTYGVPRADGSHGEAPLLSTFARLAEVAAAGLAAPALADLAVAELLALNPPDSPASGRGR